MEKRLIIAVALSFLVILSFNALSPKSVQAPVAQETANAPAAQVAHHPIDSSVTEPVIPFIVSEEETAIETDKYILTFSDIGGSLKSIALKEYENSDDGLPLDLVTGAQQKEAIFAMESSILVGNLSKRTFKIVENKNNILSYRYISPGNFEITKKYVFYKTNDYIELRLSIKNIGTQVIGREYDLIGASQVQQSGKIMGRKFLEIDSMVDGALLVTTKVKNGEQFIKGIISWTGIRERYFSVILKPIQEVDGVILRQADKTNLVTGIRTKALTIYPGQSVEDLYVLYAGPNEIARLKSLGFGLEQSINFGKLGGISKVLLAALQGLHKVVRNWGVAIILLTALVNVVLFPLTKKSFLSMRKMQEIQPHIEKLKKLHKDSPQKLQKAQAELFREFKINPLGGCLPMLLQIPIFWALYQALMRSIELKGANFLWIQDLSRPDIIPIPFKLPLIGSEIHLLPLIVVVLMVIQQKVSTQSMPSSTPEQKQQQQMMAIMMPLFFGFILYNMPSGFVLYLMTSTTLMAIEHAALRKAHTTT